MVISAGNEGGRRLYLHKDFETDTDTLRTMITMKDGFENIEGFVPKDADDLTPMTKDNISLDMLKETWMSRMGEGNCLFISAKDGTGIEELKKRLYEMVKEIHTKRFPYNDFLFQHYEDSTDTEEQDL